MVRDQISSVDKSPLSGNEEHELQDLRQNAPSLVEQANPRRKETSRRKAYVLIGSSISQLPIWGFAMSYGVFQEYYNENWTLQGDRDITGIIGTTSNGVMYLSMPFLFALFTKRWARRRRTAALCGAVLACVSFVISSFSKNVWHLVATQGVLAALGCALIYSPMTLSLGEWYSTKNRALAYGVTLSSKNIVGSVCPFMFRGLLDHYDFRMALRIWTAVLAGTSILSVLLIPTPPSTENASSQQRKRKIPWSFLKHQTFHIYCVAIILQTAGYGIPQTYLSTYAREAIHLSQTSATLLLTVFNLPGIAASTFFGYLSDEKRFSLSATTVTAISATSTALSAFLFWGLTPPGSMALLVVFAITFGFFAGGYSATWGGMLNEMEREAAQMNEAIDTGMVYGLLNGARGIGYVGGGLASIPLINSGEMVAGGIYGYGTRYGPLIIFTGITSIFGGWSILWKFKKLKKLLRFNHSNFGRFGSRRIS